MRLKDARHARTSLGLALALQLAARAAAGAAADSTATPLPAFPPPEVRAWQTGALRPDRMQHASLAFCFGLGLGVASGEPAAAAGGAAVLALAKELSDSRTGRFDRGDLIAGLVGAACAAVVVAALEP
jgi:hypothetical protein